MEIRSRNTNTLMLEIIRLFNIPAAHIVREQSRNGPVMRFAEPVTICLTHPWERVNFSPVRNCNPFFHLMEAVAMLGKTNNAKLLSHFAKNMLSFSDDGQTYNAFYGTRLRAYRSKRWMYPSDAITIEQDQLDEVIQILKADTLSRQAVALLWDPADLMYMKTKDKACNLSLIFSIDRGTVRMTTHNRSNDAVWGGVMGANVVHFSCFHEYVALAIGLPMGEWWHHSNNLHVYEDRGRTETSPSEWSRLAALNEADYQDVYPNVDRSSLVELFPSGSAKDRVIFEEEMHTFLASCIGQFKSFDLSISPKPYRNRFIAEVAVPMYNAWQAHKNEAPDVAMKHAETIASPDWRVACVDWLDRRASRRAAEAAKGGTK